MKTRCPQCGAEIEFRFDDSFVRVCGHCRAAVTRTDRGIETLGKIADLTPLDSPLALFAEGDYGGQSFLLVGKAQVRHQAGGLWQEWYAKFSGGVWGWLAEAQGRLYMTFEVRGLPAPAPESMTPGARLELPTNRGPRWFTVAETGVAEYQGADGELPYRLTPQTRFRYVDLADGEGGFATIDYGEPGDPAPPTVYVGHQVSVADLRIHGGEMAPPAAPTITSQRLACPQCNGSLELRAPDAALRVVCPYCNTMLEVGNGNALSVLTQLQRRAKPLLRLGSNATFSEGEFTIIGYLKRSARVFLTWYPFEEYLLHSPRLGFRWLVCSDGHWSYVQPVDPGACQRASGVTYQGVRFKPFQAAPLRVDEVLGEFYWRVSVGDTAVAEDFYAPPAMLSCESSKSEVAWSLSTYLTPAELRAAVGERDLELPRPSGVAPNQPWPHTGVLKYYAVLIAAFLVVSFMVGTRSERAVTSFDVRVPSGPPPPLEDPGAAPAPPNPDAGHVFFSEPFQLVDGDNIEIKLSTSLVNDWMYVVADLVNEHTGAFVTFDTALEFYQGFEGGEYWSEGTRSKSTTLSAMPSGSYVLRLEALRGGRDPGGSEPIPLRAVVHQRVFQTTVWGLGLLAVLLPGVFLFLGARRFEKRRMENSDYGDDD